MGIGSKIKEYRTKAGLTQKDLADELHITYQAVSRWENDDAEPSFDMLKDMCRILNCSTDDLFDMKKEEPEEKAEPQPQIIERIIIKETEQKPVLGVCEQCNKPIFEASDLFRINESHSVRSGRSFHTINKEKILCNECNEIRLLQEKEAEVKRKAKEIADLKKRRIHSFIWPSILALILIIISIIAFAKGNSSFGAFGLILAVLGYTFLGTMILNNTFLTDLWLDITSWGFVTMPGIIFEFSFDGIVFLITMKIILFLLGIGLALLAAIFSTTIALILSIFVYPFALKKNLKGGE